VRSPVCTTTPGMPLWRAAMAVWWTAVGSCRSRDSQPALTA
jgi:hypothetical protein